MGTQSHRTNALGPRRHGIDFDMDEFQKHFILIYTGKPHHSGLNNWQIFKDHIDGIASTYESFERLKNVAQGMYQRVAIKLGELW